MKEQEIKKAVKAHLSEIGKKGGKIRAKLYSKEQLKEWGAKGGRPVKLDRQVKSVSSILST